MTDKTPTDEEIEQVVSEFCSELQGHRQAIREIAQHYIEKGRQMERERILSLLPEIPYRFHFNSACFDCVERIKNQAPKGEANE